MYVYIYTEQFVKANRIDPLEGSKQGNMTTNGDHNQLLHPLLFKIIYTDHHTNIKWHNIVYMVKGF